MKITIDTKHDSPQNIRHAISLLSSYVTPHTHVRPRIKPEIKPQIPSEISPGVSAAMNALFQAPSKQEKVETFNDDLGLPKMNLNIERY